jgi:hypothetical protein
LYCPRHLQASDQRLGFGDGARCRRQTPQRVSLIEVMLPRGVVSKTLLRQRLQGRARAGEMDHGLTCMSHKSVNTRLGN